MRRLSVFIIAGLFAMALCAPVLSQRIAGSLSSKFISIDSTFSGETLTLFGNVEPEIGSGDGSVNGPYDIVVIIQGPAVDRVARQKTRNAGIWLNTEQVVFRAFPSYFQVLSSDRLENIASEETLTSEGILPKTRPHLALVQGSGDPSKFGPQLVRLMTEQGLFGVDERGVIFRSNTLFSARIDLPANVPNGNFLAITYLFKNGEIVVKKAEGFTVRKTGFEQLLGTSAKQYPWAYGMVCVMLAVFTGWLGGVVFRR